MELKKQQKLKELKKKYGYDVAILKTSEDHNNLTDEDLLKSLLLFDVQNVIYDAINDYSANVDFSPDELSALTKMLLNTSDEIVGNISRQSPGHMLLLRKIANNLFNNHFQEYINGTNSTEQS